MASINLKNVCVEIPIYDSRNRSLKSAAIATARFKRVDAREHGIVTVHSLADINLSLKDGNRVGLIGHNGSGKSTLLRVLAGVYEPTAGSIKIDGRCSSLLNLTGAMDMEASGDENIMLLGLARGMSRKQIIQHKEGIIEFAELGDHMKLPVRTYSSGMQLRLAFAVATAKASDILLIDEVIGVGDFDFVEKAKKRMNTLMGNAKILVVASHDDHVLKATCNTGIVLQDGRAVFSGPIDDALAHYHQ